MIQMIAVEKLHPHPNNPRKDLGDITELADSIKAQGVLQNLTVVPYEGSTPDDFIKPDHYTIVIGHRRHAAAQLAGLTELPCVISEMTEQQQIETMLLENIQRSELTVIEQAEGFQMMMSFGDSIGDVAAKTGFSETTIRHRLRLNEHDKKQLAEAVGRGATLLDLIKLEELKDPERKAKALEVVGTSNFEWTLKNLLEDEANAPKRDALIAMLDGWAKEVTGYQNADQVKHFHNFEIEGFKKPTDAETGGYTYTVNRYGITLYKKPVKEKKKVSKKEAAFKEREAQLKEATKRAYELRYAFVKDFGAAKKHSKEIMAMAFQRLLNYGRAEKDDVMKLLGIAKPEFEEGMDWLQKERVLKDLILKQFNIAPERLMFIASYCQIGDSGKNGYYCAYSYCFTINHVKNESLDSVYDTLISLGYQMSDEEKALQDGTHVLFDQPEKEAEQPEENRYV